MKLAMIGFTEHGSRLCAQLQQMLSDRGYIISGYGVKKYACKYGLLPLESSLLEWTKGMFEQMDGLLFIGAAGIAVRSIAPFLTDKTKDPAVVVMDEKGIFSISLLSGHLGGANELTAVLANLTGAIPVITTATDVNGRFAVDLFAKKQNLHIGNIQAAKSVSADILDEEPVGLVSEFEIIGGVPEELSLMDEKDLFEGKTGIVISLNEEKQPFTETLHLTPRIITVGVGCRRDTEIEMIEEAVVKTLQANHLSIHGVEQIVSIDLKKEEQGILKLCEKYRIPFRTYTTTELLQVKGDFTASDFVQSVTGVDNICERSALLGSKNGTLIQKKRAGNGVTVAIAVKDWSVDFG